MNTKTLKLNRDVVIPDHAFEPSIPAYMEASGVCSVLVHNIGRRRDEPIFEERWIKTSGYISCAHSATDIETEVYQTSHNPDELDAILDVPEPINVHDQDIWLECIEGEYDDFVHDYQSLQFEDEDQRLYA